MKTTDLRVGNTVYFSADAGNTFQIGNITVDDLADFQNHPELCEKRFKPVLLTDPVLYKAKTTSGIFFLFDGEQELVVSSEPKVKLVVVRHYVVRKYWRNYPVFVPQLHNEYGDCVKLNPIEYLHELQNLVFALTGKEVKFYGI